MKLLITIAMIAWASVATANNPKYSQIACEEVGGIWGRYGLLEVDQCNLPTNDANKICTDSSECEGVCFTEESAPKDTKISGICYGWTITLGTCLNLIKNGIAQGQICED
jgi:hypothetical protein